MEPTLTTFSILTEFFLDATPSPTTLHVWYTLEFVLGVVLFICILWQRVELSLYKVNKTVISLHYVSIKLGQVGLAVQGLMAFLLMVDAVESCYINYPPKVILIIFALGTVLSKSVHIYSAILNFIRWMSVNSVKT